MLFTVRIWVSVPGTYLRYLFQWLGIYFYSSNLKLVGTYLYVHLAFCFEFGHVGGTRMVGTGIRKEVNYTLQN